MKKLQGWAAAAAASTTNTSVGDSCFKSICVFCESSSENGTVYQAARELGTELVQRNADLVYGGGSIGPMGAIAVAVHTGGGKVTGVIPKDRMGQETIGVSMPADDEEHQCKVMAGLADAFIALPGAGGSGTLQKSMEIIKWSKLCGHAKPVGLLNVNGYYDPLLMFVDNALNEGVLNDAARCALVSAPTPKELVDKMVNMPKPTCLGKLLKFLSQAI